MQRSSKNSRKQVTCCRCPRLHAPGSSTQIEQRHSLTRLPHRFDQCSFECLARLLVPQAATMSHGQQQNSLHLAVHTVEAATATVRGYMPCAHVCGVSFPRLALTRSSPCMQVPFSCVLLLDHIKRGTIPDGMRVRMVRVRNKIRRLRCQRGALASTAGGGLCEGRSAPCSAPRHLPHAV